MSDYKWKFDDVSEGMMKAQLKKNVDRLIAAQNEIERIESQNVAMLIELKRRNRITAAPDAAHDDDARGEGE